MTSDPSLGGVESHYTSQMAHLIGDSRGASPAPITEKSQYRLSCIALKENRYYIGLKQELLIKAPIKDVAATVDDIDHYKDLYPGYNDVHVEKKDGNVWLTFWEQNVPVPFVSNVKYRMIYKLDWLSPDEKLYRYQLQAPTELVASDGFILLKKISDTETSYLEYDFFDAKWGAAKIFGRRKIWFDSVEGLLLSDLSTKLKAEHMDWAPKKALAEARKIKYQDDVVSCILPAID